METGLDNPENNAASPLSPESPELLSPASPEPGFSAVSSPKSSGPTPSTPSSANSTGESPQKVRGKPLTEKRRRIIFDFLDEEAGNNGAIGSEVWKLKLFEYFTEEGNDPTVSILDVHRWVKKYPWIIAENIEEDFSEMQANEILEVIKRGSRKVVDAKSATPRSASLPAKRRRLATKRTDEPSISPRVQGNEVIEATKRTADKAIGVDLEDPPLEQIPTKRPKLLNTHLEPLSEPDQGSSRDASLSMPVLRCPSPVPSKTGSEEMPKLKCHRASSPYPYSVSSAASCSQAAPEAKPIVDYEEEFLQVIRDLKNDMTQHVEQHNENQLVVVELVADHAHLSSLRESWKVLVDCVKTVHAQSIDGEEVDTGLAEPCSDGTVYWADLTSEQPAPDTEQNLPNVEHNANVGQDGTVAEAQDLPSSCHPICIATSISVVGENIPPNLTYVSSGIQPVKAIQPICSASTDIKIQADDENEQESKGILPSSKLVRPWEDDIPVITITTPSPSPDPAKNAITPTSEDSGSFSANSESLIPVLVEKLLPGNSLGTNSVTKIINAPGTGSRFNQPMLGLNSSVLQTSRATAANTAANSGFTPDSGIRFSAFLPPTEHCRPVGNLNASSSNGVVNLQNSSAFRDANVQVQAFPSYQPVPPFGLKNYNPIIARQAVLDLQFFMNGNLTGGPSASNAQRIFARNATSTATSPDGRVVNVGNIITMLRPLHGIFSTTPGLENCLSSYIHIMRELAKFQRAQVRSVHEEAALAAAAAFRNNGNGGDQSPGPSESDDDIELVDIDGDDDVEN